MSGTLPFEQRRAREKGKFGNLVVIKLCRRGCHCPQVYSEDTALKWCRFKSCATVQCHLFPLNQ